MADQQRRQLAALIAVFVLHRLAQKILDPLAISGFMVSAGARHLPWLWATDLLTAVPAAAWYARSADRWPRRTLVRKLYAAEALLCAGIALAAWCGLPRGVYTTATYVFTALDVLVVRAAVWTLATEALPTARAATMLPRIAAVLTLVDLVSYTASGLFSWQVGQGIAAWDPAVLALSALGYAGAATLVGRGATDAPLAADAAAPTGLRVALRSVAGLPALGVGVACCWTAMSALQLYNFLATELAAGGDEGRLRALYAAFGCLTLLAVWATQFVASRLLARVAPPQALLVLPATLLTALALAVSLPGLLGAWLADALHYVGYDGWDGAARYAWMARVPESLRGRAVAFIETQAYSAGSLVGALLLGTLALLVADARVLALACLATVGCFGVAGWVALRRLPAAAPVDLEAP